MVKLKINSKAFYGTTTTFSVGEVSFDRNGITELSEEKAQELLKSQVPGKFEILTGESAELKKYALSEAMDIAHGNVTSNLQKLTVMLTSGDFDKKERDSIVKKINESVDALVEAGDKFMEEKQKESDDTEIQEEEEPAQETQETDPEGEEVQDEGDVSDEEIKELEQKIKDSTVSELKEIAANAELPRKEWESLRKAELQSYLLDQLKTGE